MTMTTQAMTTTRHDDAALMEQVLLGGNLANLSPTQRLSYYRAVCDSIGLNPLTKPFDYLTLNGKLVLYAKKDATDQLRHRRGVSIVRLERDKIEGVYTVTAYARTTDGREDSSIGAVSIDGLRGEALAIADRNSTRIHSQISTSHESASLPSRDAEKAMKFSREAQEWLKSYSGSIDSTALLLAFDAGRSAGRSASRVRKAAREYLDARDALSAALDEGSLSFANAFIDAFQVTRHKLAALRAADAEET
jgi:hypothetical protein